MDQENENEDHLKYLGQPISDINSLRNLFSGEELKIINKYGAWMEALADHKLKPKTAEQKRFVEVALGFVEPKSNYEKIWMKIFQARNDSFYLKYKKKSKIIWDEQKIEISKIPKTIKDYLDSNLLDIESREDISIKEKSDRIIHLFCAICAASATQPLPGYDIFYLTPMQFYMATKLSAIHDVTLKKATIWEILTDIGKVAGLGYLAMHLTVAGYKTIIPYFGGYATAPMVYGMTYAIGRILNEMYIRRSKNKDKMTEKEIKEMFKKMKKEGIDLGKKKNNEINSTKKKL
jgi:uncharacterized protein (DUF697 family)/uncharacterized protein YifE (UPF0438 family)